MTRRGIGSKMQAAILVALCALVATPVYAQLGSLKGRVVDEDGNPVADAELTFEYSGEMNYRYTGKSNAKGEWIRAGLYSVGGRWTVSAKKGNLAGFVGNIDVPLSAVGEVGDIVIRAGGRVAGPNQGMSDIQAEQAAKEQAALKKVFDEANAAAASGSYDVALGKLNEALTKVPQCAPCYLSMGDINIKKTDLAAAEAAYKKALEVDAKSVEAYDGLAIVYNSQRNFTAAAEASKQASELRSSGTSAGGGDANSFYNAGVIFWNQSKMEEANAQFEKAVKADPTMAEAYYQLAMTQLNLGKEAEAKESMRQYLKLAPNGPNAETAKLVLGAS